MYLSEIITDQPVKTTGRYLYQIDAEALPFPDHETLSKIDCVLKKLDQIEN